MPQYSKTEKPKKIRNSTLFLAEIMILQIMGNFTNSSYAPLSHFIKLGFLLNEASVGLITSAVFIGSMSMSFLSGVIVDSLGPIRTLKISYAILAVGSILAYFAQSYFLLIGAYYLIGAGYGMVTPATNSSIMDRFYPNHASPMGFKQSGVPIGTILAAIALPLLALHYSLRIAFLFLFFITAIIAVITRGEKPGSFEKPSMEKTRGTMKNVFRDRRILFISAITAFLSWGQQSVFTYFVLYVTSINYQVLIAETLFIVLLLGSVLGRILWPSVTMRLFKGHRLRNYALIMGLAGLMLFIFPNTGGSIYAVSIMAVAIGFTAVAWNSNYVTLISEIAPKGNVGLYSGTSMMITSLGSIIGTPLSGYIVDITGGKFSIMWMFLGSVLIMVALILFLFTPRLMSMMAKQENLGRMPLK